jgi:hypothetical protein
LALVKREGVLHGEDKKAALSLGYDLVDVALSCPWSNGMSARMVAMAIFATIRISMMIKTGSGKLFKFIFLILLTY